MTTKLPVLRWGITGTGVISTWFVEDLLVKRKDAKALHMIQAIGAASSRSKAKSFADRYSLSDTKVYGSYKEVYDDPDVDIIHIGTPHSFHKNDCLQAIAAGKHVLNEKSFTLTTEEAKEVIAAAREKGVFLMEGMWTRFSPVTLAFHKLLHEYKIIGDVFRCFCEAGFHHPLFETFGPESRWRNPALGAGSLLDLGVYCVTWGLLALDPFHKSQPEITAVQTVTDGVDDSTTIILHYPQAKQQAILTSSTQSTTESGGVFARVYGNKGFIEVGGAAAPAPAYIDVTLFGQSGAKPTRHTFENPGRGFFWEADAIALDIAAGRKENATMPWSETIRVMEIMDEARRQGGARFPPDRW